MIVLDASALADLLLARAPGAWVRSHLATDADAVTVHLVDIEIASALRRLERLGELTPQRAERALAELEVIPIERFPMQPLLGRIWTHRHNLSAYDAAYVALAEALRATLVTTDAKLARAPGIATTVAAHPG